MFVNPREFCMPALLSPGEAAPYTRGTTRGGRIRGEGMKKEEHRVSLFNLLAVMLSWALMSLLFVMFYLACFNPSNQLLSLIHI